MLNSDFKSYIRFYKGFSMLSGEMNENSIFANIKHVLLSIFDKVPVKSLGVSFCEETQPNPPSKIYLAFLSLRDGCHD